MCIRDRTYSVGGLILSNSGAVTANYWLSEIYDEEIAEAHRNADIHIHDLSMLTGYCAGWSLKPVSYTHLSIYSVILSTFFHSKKIPLFENLLSVA